MTKICKKCGSDDFDPDGNKCQPCARATARRYYHKRVKRKAATEREELKAKLFAQDAIAIDKARKLAIIPLWRTTPGFKQNLWS